jgi:hypothetical protein
LKNPDAEEVRRITIVDAGNGVDEEFGVEPIELAAAIVRFGWTVNDDGGALDEPEPKAFDLVHYEEDEAGAMCVVVEYESDKYLELCSVPTEIDCSVIRAAKLFAAERNTRSDAKWLKKLSEQQLKAARKVLGLLGDIDTMTWTCRYGGIWSVSTGLAAAIGAAASQVT